MGPTTCSDPSQPCILKPAHTRQQLSGCSDALEGRKACIVGLCLVNEARAGAQVAGGLQLLVYPDHRGVQLRDEGEEDCTGDVCTDQRGLQLGDDTKVWCPNTSNHVPY